MDMKHTILDAAELMTRKDGYSSFSLNKLADNVGIKKSSLYHHFQTKSDILLAIVRRYVEAEYSLLDQIQIEHERAADRLEMFVKACREMVRDGDLLCLTVALCLEQSNLSAAIQSELIKFHHVNIAWLKNTFALAQSDGSVTDLGDPEAEAYACFALVDGAQLLARTNNNTAIFDKAVDPLRSRLISI